MFPELEALLILQERDRRIAALEAELTRIPVEEQHIEQKLKNQLLRLQTLKEEARQTESARKKLDLDVMAKKDRIAKYKTQQTQTRKNEEFAALNHEIEVEEKEIVALEDEELELMGLYEQAQKAVAAEQAEAQKHEENAQRLKGELQKKKGVLEAQLAEVRAQEQSAAGQISEEALARYRRILSSKKDAAIVPIQHGACGGCHMKLTTQTVISAQRADSLVACENCGRLVYWVE
jgi:predicted  nucleic acid-binding Zn-ribbon protein